VLLSCYIIYSILLPSGMGRFIVGRGRNGGLRIIGDGQSKDSIRYYIQTDIFCLGKVELSKWYSSRLRMGLHEFVAVSMARAPGQPAKVQV